LSIYEKNIKALEGVDPYLAEQLQGIETNAQFEVFLAQEDIAHANILNKAINQTIYGEDPYSEIKQKLQDFQAFDNYPILYFFGLGNGSFYKELLKNTKHQSTTVVEPELELIYIALNLIDFEQEIRDKRLIIKLSRTVDKQYFIEYMAGKTKFFLKVYDFHIYSKFYDVYKDEIDRVNKAIIEAFRYLIYIVGNSAGDSLIGLEYSLKNIPKMFDTPGVKNLLEKALNRESAVVVSTGPSLAKQLPLLKEIQNFITILCIDASFPILVKAGIKPDIVFSIERVDLTGEFYKNTPKEKHKDVIFSLATVCHDETINNIHGQKSFFMRSDSYNIFFGLDEYGYLGGGQSAANYAFDFAVQADYKNITFIGQDLAYGKDGSSHSKNHVFGEDEVKDSRIDGYVEAYGGDGEVATTKIWRAFLNSFNMQVKYAKANICNSTEGGARIQYTKEISFENFCKTYLDKTKAKELIKLDIPTQKTIEKNLNKFKTKKEEAIKVGQSMVKQSKKVYLEFDSFLNSIKNYSDDEILEKVSLGKLTKLISGISAVKDKYNNENFSSFYGTLLLAYVINHEFDVAQVYVMRDHTELAKKKKNIAWIQVHHEWLQRVYTNVEEIIKLLKK